MCGPRPSRRSSPPRRAGRPANPIGRPPGCTREIVDGVADHREEIDELLTSYAQGWTLDRMPNVDRAVLRIASWEILHNPEVPNAVAIDEAVELAKEYSTEDSARFVNGVLGRIAQYASA